MSSLKQSRIQMDSLKKDPLRKNGVDKHLSSLLEQVRQGALLFWRIFYLCIITAATPNVSPRKLGENAHGAASHMRIYYCKHNG